MYKRHCKNNKAEGEETKNWLIILSSRDGVGLERLKREGDVFH